MAATVRIDPATHAALARIARAEHVSLTEALSRAVETHRRKLFLEQVARDFEALRADSKAWREEMGERAAWEATVQDGLEDEPEHPDAGSGERGRRKRRSGATRTKGRR